MNENIRKRLMFWRLMQIATHPNVKFSLRDIMRDIMEGGIMTYDELRAFLNQLVDLELIEREKQDGKFVYTTAGFVVDVKKLVEEAQENKDKDAERDL